MTTLLTDEQLLLRDSARELLAARHPIAWVREWTRSEPARRAEMHAALWKRFAEMGWLGLLLPEEQGGMALTHVEQTIVLEELGRGLVPSAYLSTLLGTALLARSDDEALAREACPRIAAGDLVLAVAVAEAEGDDPTTFAARWSESGAVTGTKAFVADVPVADQIVVAARDARDDLVWVLVDRDAKGITVESPATMDETRPLHRITLDETPARLVGRFAALWPDAEPIHWLALAAEAVGGCTRVLESAVAYAKDRVQFDAPIGANQAIKHKCSDMLVRTEGARAITYHAARELGRRREEGALACSMAKAYATEAYREVAAEGIQIHGGVGFTWEFDCHLFYKRARANEIAAGHPDEHRERIARGVGL